MAMKENRSKMNFGLQKSQMVKSVKRLDTGKVKTDKRSALENIGNVDQARKIEKLENRKIDNKIKLTTSENKTKDNGIVVPMETDDKSKQEIEISMEVNGDRKEANANIANVEDIDKDDIANPQLASEYANEIFSYMRKMEKDQAVVGDYMGNNRAMGKQELYYLHPRMRAVLVDWLVEVHNQFQLLQETLYLTVAIMDRYLSASAIFTKRSELQLVGVTSMFIASKYEEMYCPEVNDFVYITDNAFNKDQIKAMERNILSCLDFSLGRPLPLHFLRRGSKAAFASSTVHTLAKYIMELAMVQYDLVDTPPSLIAAASLLLALRLAQSKAEGGLSVLWTPTLVHFTGYTFQDVKFMTQNLARVLAAARENKHQAVFKKYSKKKFMKIALNFLPLFQVAENLTNG